MNSAPGRQPTLLPIPEPFRFIDIVGVGGFGCLARVSHPETGLESVLKLPHGSTLSNPAMLRRFRHEVELHAGLDIPGVARATALMADARLPCLAFDYYRLGNLATFMEARKAPLPVEDVVRFGTRMAEALASLHDRQVIHRDIRPENLLVGQSNPLEADITDFGMAMSIGDSAGLTRLAESDGFLAPEVTGAIKHAATKASDVWSAGMVMAYLAWGPNLYLEILKDKCPPPCDTPEGRHLLLCLRHCTETWPADRYPDGKRMLQDLRLVGRGCSPAEAESFLARRTGWRLTRRAALVTASLGGATLAGHWIFRGQPTIEPESSESEAWKAAARIVTAARAGEMDDARRQWLEHQRAIESIPWLAHRVLKALHPDKAEMEWRGKPLPEIYHLDFSPDGKRLAAACQDGTVRVWSWPGREPLMWSEPIGCEVNMVFFGASGSVIWSVADDGAARAHDIRQGCSVSRSFAVSMLPIPAACLQGDALYAGDTSGEIHKMDTSTGVILWRRHPASGRVESIAAKPDGSMIAVGLEDGLVAVLATLDGSARGQFRTVPDIRWIDWVDGDILVAGPSNKVYRHSAKDFTETWSWGGTTGQSRSVVMANPPEGRSSFVLATADKGKAAMLDPRSGIPIRVYHGAPELVRHARPSPDGQSIIAVGRGGNPAIFDATRGPECLDWPDAKSPWIGAEWVDNTTMAAMTEDGCLWKSDGNRLNKIGAITKPTKESRLLGFHASAYWLWKSEDNLILTSAKGGKAVFQGAALALGGIHLDAKYCVVAVPGNLLFATALDGFASFTPVHIDQKRTEAIQIVRDGERLAIVCEDTIIVLGLPGMVELTRLERGAEFGPLCAALIAPGQIVIGRRLGRLVVHDIDLKNIRMRAAVTGGTVTALAANQATGLLLAASVDGCVRSFDTRWFGPGPEWQVPHLEKVSKLAISPDGCRFLAVSAAGAMTRITMWD